MKKKTLILGCTGMLGHVIFTNLSLQPDLDVYATARTASNLSKWFTASLIKKIFKGVNIDNFDTIAEVFTSFQPEIVINCIGLIKQLPIANDPLSAIKINALFPHQISKLCRSVNARMIHISTDCVFNGSKGNYTEQDQSDAGDLYGRSKFLGEVEYSHCITLRTSVIGHELKGKLGLLEWFLSQENKIRGFTHALYSGFPTIELARIIADYVIPNKNLTGMYHVSSETTSKYDLLKIVSKRYKKVIEIEPYQGFQEDHSLDSSLFRRLTGYVPPEWPILIKYMYQHFLSFENYKKEK